MLFFYSALLFLFTVFLLPRTAAQETGELTPVQLRAMFLPAFLQDFADTNTPLPTSPDSAVPSAECVESCFDALQLEAGDRIYIIGRGTGFLTAFFAQNGMEVTVSEADDKLLQEYQTLWRELGLTGIRHLELDKLRAASEPRQFEAVLIHAAVQTIPESITGLLTDDGALLAPISNPQDTQVLIKMKRSGENWSLTTLDEQFFPSRSIDLGQE